MNLPKTVPPRDFLQECFVYLPETGELIWRERPRSHFQWEYAWKRFLKYSAGKSAMVVSWRDTAKTNPRNCMVKVTWNNFKGMYPAHRIIFGLQGVEVPEGSYIDHINGNPHDNRWENLRIATPSQNSQNKRNQRDRKHDLPKGVQLHTAGKFAARITLNGQRTYLGVFDTAEEAHRAYCEVAEKIHGEFHRAI